MNPHETQAGGSARDHLSAIEAHIKGRPLDPAFSRVIRVVSIRLCLREASSERSRNMVSPSPAKLCPAQGSEPKVTNLEGKTEREDVER